MRPPNRFLRLNACGERVRFCVGADQNVNVVAVSPEKNRAIADPPGDDRAGLLKLVPEAGSQGDPVGQRVEKGVGKGVDDELFVRVLRTSIQQHRDAPGAVCR